jgi:hypothetical protein
VTAARHAQWLAELAEALEDAQRLLWRLGPSTASDVDILDLLARVEVMRAQVRGLRLGRTPVLFDEFDPNWMSSLLWDRRNEGCGA